MASNTSNYASFNAPVLDYQDFNNKCTKIYYKFCDYMIDSLIS